MIVLDLEWNQPFGGRRMEEIIQIGAVRLAEPGGAVQDWFNMHIRPSIYPKLSPVARKLPESAQALTAELDFPAAYQAFHHPVALEEIRADAGLDIGGTLIGMHLRPVAVPVRLSVRRIGEAPLLCARTRPKFIGGCRAHYQNENER